VVANLQRPSRMTLASHVRRLLAERGLVASRRQSLRYGVAELRDVERLVSHVRVVLDVGANDGATALAFTRTFRGAGVPRITCFEAALGAEEGEATIRLVAKSGQSSLLNATEPGPGTTTVRVTTGDAWTSEHGIEGSTCSRSTPRGSR